MEITTTKTKRGGRREEKVLKAIFGQKPSFMKEIEDIADDVGDDVEERSKVFLKGRGLGELGEALAVS